MQAPASAGAAKSKFANQADFRQGMSIDTRWR